MKQRSTLLLQSALAVFIGGIAGSFIRIALSELQPSTAVWPWMTMLINFTGAFLLGCLLEYVGMTGEDVGARRLWRLGIGTGVIGGYTTYSTFILETDTRLTHHMVLIGVSYMIISILIGLVCAGLGIAVGSKLARIKKAGTGEIGDADVTSNQAGEVQR